MAVTGQKDSTKGVERQTGFKSSWLSSCHKSSCFLHLTGLGSTNVFTCCIVSSLQSRQKDAVLVSEDFVCVWQCPSVPVSHQYCYQSSCKVSAVRPGHNTATRSQLFLLSKKDKIHHENNIEIINLILEILSANYQTLVYSVLLCYNPLVRILMFSL